MAALLEELAAAGVDVPAGRRQDKALYDWASLRVAGYRLAPDGKAKRTSKWSLPKLRVAWRAWQALRADSGPPVRGEQPRIRMDDGGIYVERCATVDAGRQVPGVPDPIDVRVRRVIARVAGPDAAARYQVAALKGGSPPEVEIADAVRAVEAYDSTPEAAGAARGGALRCHRPPPCNADGEEHAGCRAARALFAAIVADGRTARPALWRELDRSGASAEERLGVLASRDAWREDLDRAIAAVDWEIDRLGHEWSGRGSEARCLQCATTADHAATLGPCSGRAGGPGGSRDRSGIRRRRALLIVSRATGIPEKRLKAALRAVPK